MKSRMPFVIVSSLGALNVARAGGFLLAASFGVACGSSSASSAPGGAEGGLPGDAGGSKDQQSGPDVGVGAPDAGNAGDTGNPGTGVDSGSPPAPGAVDLGTAANYVILSKTGISTVPTSAVTGNLGVSPAAATYITGFSLTADPTNVFATSPQVIGKVFAADYATPTPSNLTAAIGDMQLAFTDAAGRAPTVTELGAGNIGGMTLTPGVYKWGTGLLVPTDVTLAGSANDVWIFQIAQDLTVSSATSVTLSGGAVARNVFWEVAGLVTLGTTVHFEGVILTQTSISLGTGASINGRLLAQADVSIDDSAVVAP
jgi:hypothetical protein